MLSVERLVMNSRGCCKIEQEKEGWEVSSERIAPAVCFSISKTYLSPLTPHLSLLKKNKLWKRVSIYAPVRRGWTWKWMALSSRQAHKLVQDSAHLACAMVVASLEMAKLPMLLVPSPRCATGNFDNRSFVLSRITGGRVKKMRPLFVWRKIDWALFSFGIIIMYNSYMAHVPFVHGHYTKKNISISK